MEELQDSIGGIDSGIINVPLKDTTKVAIVIGVNLVVFRHTVI